MCSFARSLRSDRQPDINERSFKHSALDPWRHAWNRELVNIWRVRGTLPDKVPLFGLGSTWFCDKQGCPLTFKVQLQTILYCTT